MSKMKRLKKRLDPDRYMAAMMKKLEQEKKHDEMDGATTTGLPAKKPGRIDQFNPRGEFTVSKAIPRSIQNLIDMQQRAAQTGGSAVGKGNEQDGTGVSQPVPSEPASPVDGSGEGSIQAEDRPT